MGIESGVSMSEENTLTNEDVIIESENIFQEISYLNDLSDSSYELIGKHVRHVVDHMNTVINGYIKAEYNGEPGIIDYPGTRTRDSLLETSFRDFKIEIFQIIDTLKYKKIDLTKNVTKIDTIPSGKKVHIVTNYQSEILYAHFQHKTHHLDTMVRILKANGINVENSNIGKAASTIAFEASKK
ncbi:hypothetical protein A9Q91_03810 [Candidatus Gracilibacteria bacterium 28_42_T64]|nr:hypothetical protein A9Q91_03810 [Candidatus Gracilibacteria bacterium 28_42_T64]